MVILKIQVENFIVVFAQFQVSNILLHFKLVFSLHLNSISRSTVISQKGGPVKWIPLGSPSLLIPSFSLLLDCIVFAGLNQIMVMVYYYVVKQSSALISLTQTHAELQLTWKNISSGNILMSKNIRSIWLLRCSQAKNDSFENQQIINF